MQWVGRDANIGATSKKIISKDIFKEVTILPSQIHMGVCATSIQLPTICENFSR